MKKILNFFVKLLSVPLGNIVLGLMLIGLDPVLETIAQISLPYALVIAGWVLVVVGGVRWAIQLYKR